MPVIAPISGVVIDVPSYENYKTPNESIATINSINNYIKSGGVRIQSINPPGFLAVIRHMTSFFVNKNDPVIRGQLIGLTGSVGATSPHIHFEMWKGTSLTEGITVIPEPIDGNNVVFQQINDNSYLAASSEQASDGFIYKSEDNAIISPDGGFQSSGIYGFNHTGKLSLSSQVIARYHLGYFSARNKIDQISFFVPSSLYELNVRENVPIPPRIAEAKIVFENSIIDDFKQIDPYNKLGEFYELPEVFILPYDGNVFLELSGNGLIFDEVRFKLHTADGGGVESPRIVITSAELLDHQLSIDIFNPFSEMQTLSKMEIIQTNDGTDTLRFESQMLNINMPPNSTYSFSIPWISISDSVIAILKLYTSTNISDRAYIRLENTTRVAINDQTPSTYLLRQNYPNPFNSSTIIEYSIPQNAHVKISIVDLLGRTLRLLLDKEQTIGNYKITFNANNLASGVYFYRIQANNFSQTKKLILLR